MSAHARRRRAEGVTKIFLFNWPFFAAAGVTIIAGLAGFVRGRGLIARLALAPTVGAFYSVAMSLAASHWIYDRSDLYRWTWLDRLGRRRPRHIVNIHAGFDETSVALAHHFPNAKMTVLDIYDQKTSMEPSIARARRLYPPAVFAIPADPVALPLNNADCDLIFLILSAHEIRVDDTRQAFFQELARALAPDGKVVLVEHLRDAANFVAFGPGFLHFFSSQTWEKSIEAGKFRREENFPITPFIRVWVLAAA